MVTFSKEAVFSHTDSIWRKSAGKNIFSSSTSCIESTILFPEETLSITSSKRVLYTALFNEFETSVSALSTPTQAHMSVHKLEAIEERI